MNPEIFLAPGPTKSRDGDRSLGPTRRAMATRLQRQPLKDTLLVREVGFEPTNPYGTGASGLRIQDP